MATRSLMRADEAGGVTVPASAAAATRRSRVRDRMSKGKQTEQETVKEERPAHGIPDHALAIDVHLELAEAVGEDAVGGVDVGGADHAADRDGLALGVDL